LREGGHRQLQNEEHQRETHSGRPYQSTGTRNGRAAHLAKFTRPTEPNSNDDDQTFAAKRSYVARRVSRYTAALALVTR
jgi:hypothetical protein